MSDLVGNPEDWFSHAMVQNVIVNKTTNYEAITVKSDFLSMQKQRRRSAVQ